MVIMRRAVLAAMLAACGAQLGPGGGGSDQPLDAAAIDAASPDAPIDARACAGGDAHMVGPQGECLVMFTTPATYVAAKAACAAIDAHLAYLKDAALDAVAETFVGSADTFIGLSDLATEGQFLWDDGAGRVHQLAQRRAEQRRHQRLRRELRDHRRRSRRRAVGRPPVRYDRAAERRCVRVSLRVLGHRRRREQM